MIGKTLGHYRVGEQLGRGGMGEVFLADDLSLSRKVALKFLPDLFTGDPDRMARFEREAKLLAALNHPNIGAIYGLEQAEGKRFLVLELVEGETLADQLKRGPIPVEESLRIALQIAEALEAAHEKGVIHRDLKPANIMVKPDGKVKVLDFGLAKALADEQAELNLSNSPTLSVAATRQGIILGTAAYMSPEQARGKTVDKRADIWAFGCVLYEMVTGRAAFQGEDVSEILASVIKGDVNLDLHPLNVHPRLKETLGRCLQKDLKKRMRDIGDVQFELGQAGAQPAAVQTTARAESQSKLRLGLPWVTAAIVLASIIAGITAWTLKPIPPGIVARLSFMLPEDQQFTSSEHHLVAISPDGTQFVYVANQRLYLKPMRELGSIYIQGTEISGSVSNPVFSPDGRSLAFYSITDRALKRIAVSGGAPVTICQADPPIGMSWGMNDQIVIGQGNKGIVRVLSNGGKPETIVSVKDTETAHGPQMLPNGDAVLFTLSGSGIDRWDKARIVVQKITSGERKTLMEGRDARYLPTGHIVYAFSGTLMAVPFDVKRLEVTGGQAPIIESVRLSNFQTGAAQFSFSDNGTLVYIPGTAKIVAQRSLALIDRNGNAKTIGVPPGSYYAPRISPNGKRLTFGTSEGKEWIVWVYELSAKESMRRLTFGGNNRNPMWSGDGERVIFQSNRGGDEGIFWQRADGAGSAERVIKAEEGIRLTPASWPPKSPRFAFFAHKGNANEGTLWTYSLQEKKAALFVDDPSTSIQGNGSFSPDGRWLAYESNETGEYEVYVQPFPATGAKFQITRGGSVESHHPLWSPDGKELFYVSSGRLNSVGIQTQSGFSFANPVQLPITGFVQPVAENRNYDITPDGKQFIVVLPPGQTAGESRPTLQIEVVLNWFEELKQRMATR